MKRNNVFEQIRERRKKSAKTRAEYYANADDAALVEKFPIVVDKIIRPRGNRIVKSTGKKIKVLLLSIWYPLSMSRYFERAFQRRTDVELRTVGPYTGVKIPWQGGIELLPKYALSPTYPTYPVAEMFRWSQAQALIEDWKPDLVITIGDRIWFDKHPDVKCPVVHVATDPHIVDYTHARKVCDTFYSMQAAHSKPSDAYLPYAFDPTVHYPTGAEKTSDCVLVGVAYNNRRELIGKLRSRGVSVIFENGPVFDEYRDLNNKAKIGLTYSCLNDIGARVFEMMAMGLIPIIDRVQDLPLLFQEDKHYLGFSSVQEGIEKVEWALSNPGKANEIAKTAYEHVWKMSENGYPQHSYDERCFQILSDAGLVK